MAFAIENFVSQELTQILVTAVIPFLIIFAVLLFALRQTRVLGSNNLIYIILSAGFTIMIYAVRPETFAFLASYLVQLSVAGAIIALLGVFIVIVFSLLRRGQNITDMFKSEADKLKALEKEEIKLRNRYQSRGFMSPNIAEREEIAGKLEKIEHEKKFLLAKLRRLH